MMLAEKRHNGEILHSPPYWLPPPSGHVADQAADLILFITIDTIKTFRDGNHEVALAALKCLVEKVNRVFSLSRIYFMLFLIQCFP